jgi:hypothetical protein
MGKTAVVAGCVILSFGALHAAFAGTQIPDLNSTLRCEKKSPPLLLWIDRYFELSIVKECAERDQVLRRGLEMNWSRYTDEAKVKCLQVIKAYPEGLANYQVLDHCVKN